MNNKSDSLKSEAKYTLYFRREGDAVLGKFRSLFEGGLTRVGDLTQICSMKACYWIQHALCIFSKMITLLHLHWFIIMD